MDMALLDPRPIPPLSAQQRRWVVDWPLSSRRLSADEVITTVRIFEPDACLRSLEILADVRQLPSVADASDSSA